MAIEGGCHCGAIRYEVSGDAKHVALCHCSDCRRSSGAPMVAWAAFDESQFEVTKGEPATFNSSGTAMRSFCPSCGSGLYYRSAEFLPGIVDVQSATFDDPNAFPAEVHIQVAERLNWMKAAHELPEFDRYPG